MTASRRIPVILITLLTLGSGLLNIYSAASRGIPGRIEFLRRLFPLEFVHLSRSITLLSGFALVVASLNVYRRKRLAFWMVAVAASFSAVFHIVKGLDYEEALLSLLLLGTLIYSRRTFTVRSRDPEWRRAVFLVALAFAAAIAYGMAGFWLLEPRDFGQNFDWRLSLRHTLAFLTLQGDASLQPRTHYAEWFLDSLYLMTAATFTYSLLAIFRPMVYQFSTHPREIERARQILSHHGRSPQDFFKARPDKSFFFGADGQSFVAYRVGAEVAVALGDPVGPEESISGVVRDFSRFCGDNGWGVAFHQALPDFLRIYQAHGFKKLKIGDDAIVDLREFSLQGKRVRPLRFKVAQLAKEGIQCRYYEPPVPAAVMEELRQVSNEWLQIPGRRERRFTLGMFEEDYIRSTPIFTAEDAMGHVLAFVNLIPSYRAGEATIDLMRRRTEAPSGVMDFLFVRLFERCREQGYLWFHLGMAPMAGFLGHEDAAPAERAIHAFFQHLNFLFSFKGLRAYKAKFATSWEPRYLIYRNVFELPRVARAISAVSEVDDD